MMFTINATSVKDHKGVAKHNHQIKHQQYRSANADYATDLQDKK